MTTILSDKTHYHEDTSTLFDLSQCDWCRGSVMENTIKASYQPESVKLWGDSKLPPASYWSSCLNSEVCDSCRGIKYYVEQVKKRWVVVIRPRGDIHAMDIDTEVKAQSIANGLNKTYDAKGFVAPVKAQPTDETKIDTKQLTIPKKSATIPDTVMVQLAEPLGKYPKGTFATVSVDTLKILLKPTGVTEMATKKEAPKKAIETAKSVICKLITQNKTDAQVIAAVKKKFPKSLVDGKHCAKYRRELFLDLEIGAELAAVGSKDYREWAETNPALAKKGVHKQFHLDKAKADKEAAAAKAKADKEAAAKKKKAA